jgi:t-SNARE complex subunit (syntaxin)
MNSGTTGLTGATGQQQAVANQLQKKESGIPIWLWIVIIIVIVILVIAAVNRNKASLVVV